MWGVAGKTRGESTCRSVGAHVTVEDKTLSYCQKEVMGLLRFVVVVRAETRGVV